MRDPSHRPPGTWPRDRPIRWGGVARNLAWYVLASAALIAQVLLALPIVLIVLLGTDEPRLVLARLVLVAVWAGLTLFAAWSWVFGRWRVLLAPLVTALALGLVLIGLDRGPR